MKTTVDQSGLYAGLDQQIRDELARVSSSAGTSGTDGPLVSIKRVHKSFGPNIVLEDINLEIERGKTTVILGPSGTGKSVLLKHIVGLIKPDRGEVTIDGTRVDTLGEQELGAVRKRVGYLFQLGALFDSMNVRENIAFPLSQHTRLDADQRAACVQHVLGLVGMQGYEESNPADLSGGQQRRIALARAVVLQPCIVLYDEPTTGLDPIRADLINELIIALTRKMGITSVVVTHDIESAYKIADRILLLREGQFICDGSPEQVRDSDNGVVQRFVRGEADEQELTTIRRAFAIDNEQHAANQRAD